jgi:hypothetical protein
LATIRNLVKKNDLDTSKLTLLQQTFFLIMGGNILNLPQVGMILDRDENFSSDSLDLLL